MARVYLLNMMLSLNMRGSGGYLMQDASIQSRVHRISQIDYDGTSISLPLSQLQSLGGKFHVQHNIVHVSQSVETHVDKVSIHVFIPSIRSWTQQADACPSPSEARIRSQGRRPRGQLQKRITATTDANAVCLQQCGHH